MKNKMDTIFKKIIPLAVRIYKSRYINRKLILLANLLLAGLCAVASVLLTVALLPEYDGISYDFLIPVAVAAVVTLALDLFSGDYKQLLRHTRTLLNSRILAKTILNTIVLFGISWGYLSYKDYLYTPNASSLIALLFFFIFLFIQLGIRYLLRVVAHYLDEKSGVKRVSRKNVLIYGVDSKSVDLGTGLQQNRNFSVIGYFSKDEKGKRCMIEGKPIFSDSHFDRLQKLVRRKRLHGIVFPNKQDVVNERDDFIPKSEAIGLTSYLCSSISETQPNTIISEGVRRIRIEDLLMREPILFRKDEVIDTFKDKTVLVTGAAGSIGSELVTQIAGLGVTKLILFDNAETPLHDLRLMLESRFPTLDFVPIIGDVRIEERVRTVFETYRPQLVLHAAAYKHVPLMEENPCESILVNVHGSRVIADMCIKYGTEKMVMISTDKAVNPTNVMGACKRAAEMYIQSVGQAIEEGKIAGRTVFVTTRFGNVLGSRGSVIHLFREQIAKGGPVTVTDPRIVRYFMSIPEACNLVLEACSLAQKTHIYVFDMGEEHLIIDLAKKMITLSGFVPEKDIKIEITGLRPGEKLYEEVLSTEEDSEPTRLEKVRRALIRPNPLEEINGYYARLAELARNVKVWDSIKLLKELVPEYKSENSDFALLDCKGNDEDSEERAGKPIA